MKLLLTAFDPFGGDVVNPALEAVKLSPAPCMSLQDIEKGIEAAVSAIAENRADIPAVEGKTH